MGSFNMIGMVPRPQRASRMNAWADLALCPRVFRFAASADYRIYCMRHERAPGMRASVVRIVACVMDSGGGQWVPGRGRAQKNRRPCGRRVCSMIDAARWSGCLDIRSLLAFGTLGDLERHFLTFFECLEAVHLYGREMREEIFAPVIRSDKPVAFGVIEPFHRTSCHSACLDRKADGLRDLFEFQGSHRPIWSCDKA